MNQWAPEELLASAIAHDIGLVKYISMEITQFKQNVHLFCCWTCHNCLAHDRPCSGSYKEPGIGFLLEPNDIRGLAA